MRLERSQFVRQVYLCLGFLCVFLGIVGIYLPLMPTTPFLLSASYFFGRSSPRFLSWLEGNRYFGEFLRNYRSGIGVPSVIVFRSLGVLWLGIFVSMCLCRHSLAWFFLCLVGVCVSVHLLSLRRSSRRPMRFTLIELLVSMGIIAVLASMLLPALSKAREKARQTTCMSNLRQIGLGLEMYVDDNHGLIPNISGAYMGVSIPIVRMYGGVTFGLGKLIEQYQVSPELFGCPSNPSRSPGYVKSAWQGHGVVQTAYIYRETDYEFEPLKSHEWNSGKAILMDFSCIAASGTSIVPHGFESVNILYSDGHVERRRNNSVPGALYTTSTPSGSVTVPPCDEIWANADAR